MLVDVYEHVYSIVFSVQREQCVFYFTLLS